MKSVYFFWGIFFYFFSTVLYAQSNISVNSVSALQAAQHLVQANSNIIISNATLNGNTLQLGTFSSNNSNILGFSDGVILATGNISVATEANHQRDKEIAVVSPINYDADLAMVAQGSQKNPAIFEFDFIPNSNVVSFSFVFASEEYPEYVGDHFNDAFVMILSGPGINGSFSNGGVNLAVVPGSNDPITIHTINQNVNSNYYTKNNCYDEPCPYTGFVYDGYTKKINVSYDNVKCGETYHLKFAITNIVDDKVGSAVFIEKGSLTDNFNPGPIIVSPNPACEGNLTQFTCIGAPNYNYIWKTGNYQIISQQQSFSYFVQQEDLPIMVEVVDPNIGCSKTIYSDILVHKSENQAPYTSGINQTGQYKYYAYKGVPFQFNIYSHDDVFEKVGISHNLNNNYSINPYSNVMIEGGEHEYLSISGLESTFVEYPFQLILEDNNACEPITATENFRIIVQCPDCEIDECLEKRGGAYLPLLPLHEVSNTIRAGYDVCPEEGGGNVLVNKNQTVEFKAGEVIFLEHGFETEIGAEFYAHIEEAACMKSCLTACCYDHFSKDDFRVDLPLPNIFTPNGDGINDVWYVGDSVNPDCAFNATGFLLEIYNRWGQKVFTHKSPKDTECCKYNAPGGKINPSYSSIFWNGQTGEMLNGQWASPANGGPLVSDGEYVVSLTLYACNGVEKLYKLESLFVQTN